MKQQQQFLLIIVSSLLLNQILTLSPKFLKNRHQMSLLSANKKKGPEWWKTGVIYQIYPKSFKDSNGDGTGDLKGIISKLDYLNDGTKKSLGIDAIWLSPFYKSPQYDSGYDISDFRAVDHIFGTLEDFQKLAKEANKRGIKIILDFVGNHSSDEHPWFIESKSSRTNPKADWYYWKDPKPDGSPPNNWYSVFGGSTWKYVEERKQYYFHEFSDRQPDLNWRNPDVKNAMLDVLRFWISKGANGFRFDAVANLMKNKDFKDEKILNKADPKFQNQKHNYEKNNPDEHPLLEEIHKVLKSEGEDILAIGEVCDAGKDWVKYYGTKKSRELDMPYYFDLLNVEWNSNSIKKIIEKQEKITNGIGWPNYVLSNHDSPRIASKFGKRNARAAALLLLTLRGTPTIYFGDELGLENTNVPVEKWTDPQVKKDPSNFCRDFSRTPMQWNNSKNAGFSSAAENKLWLPVAQNFRSYNVEKLENEPRSILNLYKNLLWFRKKNPLLNQGKYQTLELRPSEVFGFKRYNSTDSFTTVINPTDQELIVELGDMGGEVVLSSGLDRDGKIGSKFLIRANEGILIRNKNSGL